MKHCLFAVNLLLLLPLYAQANPQGEARALCEQVMQRAAANNAGFDPKDTAQTCKNTAHKAEKWRCVDGRMTGGMDFGMAMSECGMFKP